MGTEDSGTRWQARMNARYAQTLSPITLTFDRPAIGNVAFEISGWPGRPFTQIVETLTQVMEKRCGPFTIVGPWTLSRCTQTLTLLHCMTC